MKAKIKALLGIAGALAIAGAIGSAVAMSPIVQPPIKWAGGVEFASVTGTDTAIYTVPAGRSFILTDLIVTNLTGDNGFFTLYTGLGNNCTSASKVKITSVPVRANDVFSTNLQTGVGFAAGQVVCIDPDGILNVSMRGFLFTPN